jgi:hypothetical protein
MAMAAFLRLLQLQPPLLLLLLLIASAAPRVVSGSESCPSGFASLSSVDGSLSCFSFQRGKAYFYSTHYMSTLYIK